jgi:hypothetical protein
VTRAQTKGQEYLLERRMFRSLTTGEVINERWTQFAFPTVWCYDILRGLDYLRSAGVQPDERAAEAVALVEARRQPDGRWPLDLLHAHRTRIPFELEDRIGEPSRWNTLRALRVLDWYAN